MSNLQNIIEQFTMGNTIIGLARLLVEGKKDCPCMALKQMSKDEDIPKEGTVAPNEEWQEIDTLIQQDWGGTGEYDADKELHEEYPFSTLLFWADNSQTSLKSELNGKEIVKTTQEIIDDTTITPGEVWKLCSIRKVISDILTNNTKELAMPPFVRKSEVLDQLKEDLCTKAIALFFPPDDVEKAGLKINDHAIIVGLDGMGHEFVHKKFEDAIALELGIDPSNKNSEQWTGCVTYKKIPGQAPNIIHQSGNQAGPGKTVYPGIAFRYDCITNTTYHGTNLHLKDIDHPLINSFYNKDESKETVIQSTTTLTYSCNNGVCSDPGDGTGDYTTLVACERNCKSVEGLETIINPNPNPYPDLKIKFD